MYQQCFQKMRRNPPNLNVCQDRYPQVDVEESVWSQTLEQLPIRELYHANLSFLFNN